MSAPKKLVRHWFVTDSRTEHAIQEVFEMLSQVLQDNRMVDAPKATESNIATPVYEVPDLSQDINVQQGDTIITVEAGQDWSDVIASPGTINIGGSRVKVNLQAIPTYCANIGEPTALNQGVWVYARDTLAFETVEGKPTPVRTHQLRTILLGQAWSTDSELAHLLMLTQNSDDIEVDVDWSVFDEAVVEVLKGLTGYSAAAVQHLTNVNGTLQWVTTEECD
jgi:hypothetical protein